MGKGSFYIPSEEELKALAVVKEHFGLWDIIPCKKNGEQGPALQGSYQSAPGPVFGDEEEDPLAGVMEGEGCAVYEPLDGSSKRN